MICAVWRVREARCRGPVTKVSTELKISNSILPTPTGQATKRTILPENFLLVSIEKQKM